MTSRARRSGKKKRDGAHDARRRRVLVASAVHESGVAQSRGSTRVLGWPCSGRGLREGARWVYAYLAVRGGS